MTSYRYNSQQCQLMYQVNGSNTNIPTSLSDQGTLETNFRGVLKLSSSCEARERNNWYSGHRQQKCCVFDAAKQGMNEIAATCCFRWPSSDQ